MACRCFSAREWPQIVAKWAAPCSSFQMSWTSDVVRDALQGASRLADCKYEVFLQGSFANNTNIAPVGDVDLVVMMTMPIEENIVALDGRGRRNFAEAYEMSPYGWPEFRADVFKAMRRRYFISGGKRCLEVKHWDSLLRVPVDILPSIEYRNYHSFVRPGLEDYDEGVYFRHRNGTAITNYPKQHRVNGRRKARSTAGRSKAVVRCVKNARNHLSECPGLMREQHKLMEMAPSYYLECLVHNVPDRLFEGALPDVVRTAANWLCACAPTAAWPRLKCQNEIVALFGDGPDQWDPDIARKVVDPLRDMFDRTGG